MLLDDFDVGLGCNVFQNPRCDDQEIDSQGDVGRMDYPRPPRDVAQVCNRLLVVLRDCRNDGDFAFCRGIEVVEQQFGNVFTPRPQRRLVFLISDLDDSCSRRLQTVSLASANAALVAMVLPEAPSAKLMQSADDLWRQRRDELLQAAPGAVAIPFFGDPAVAANEALAKLSAKRNQ